ncbi:MAG: D-inositol 3-phosphate glycosyltransferase [Parcubacteria group bacterium ADurb.Bin326]|nr:MAG: D-inositol 3-phosphate glycosyltransferase [Parcubacteria group bacterium ADurb.Bin326]
MKVALFHCIYKPDYRGGAEVVVENIARAIKNSGKDIFVVSVGRSDRHEIIDGIDVFRIKPFNIFNFLDINRQPAWKRLLWHVIDLANDIQTWKIFKLLLKEKPDLIISNNLKGLGYGVPLLAKLMNIKHVHIIHDMQLIHPSGLYRDGQLLNFLEKAYLFFCKSLFGNPSKVVFPSFHIRDTYDRLGFFKNSTKVVLGNPLPLNVNIKKLKKDKKDDEVVFAFVGQIEEYKGIIGLLKALPGLGGNWKLLVAGDGKAIAESKKISLDLGRVVFYGHLNQDELEQKIWSETDVLINPSMVAESFGMVVIEAYAKGIPVLASDSGALPEIVKDGKTGWIFKSGDWYDLRHRLEFIIANQQAVRELSANCLREAERYAMANYLKELF